MNVPALVASSRRAGQLAHSCVGVNSVRSQAAAKKKKRFWVVWWLLMAKTRRTLSLATGELILGLRCAYDLALLWESISM